MNNMDIKDGCWSGSESTMSVKTDKNHVPSSPDYTDYTASDHEQEAPPTNGGTSSVGPTSPVISTRYGVTGTFPYYPQNNFAQMVSDKMNLIIDNSNNCD